MRKSQAPSLKTKIPTFLNNESSCKSSTRDSEINVQRSTESVLDLLLNSNSNNKSDSVESPEPRNCLTELNKPENDRKRKISLDEDNNNGDQVENSKSSVTVFNVVYGKQTKKKHKTWEGDGVLEVKTNYLTLKSEDGKILGTSPCPKAVKLEEGVRLCVGSKEVELLDLVETKLEAKPQNDKKTGTLTLMRETIIKPKSILSKKFLPPKLSYSSGVALPEPDAEHQLHFNQAGLPVTPVYIESSLSNRLREHQIAGVTFLYECVMSFKDISLTGAILADEMGLGKTLQCITLIWTLLKQGPYGNLPAVRKVLIATPSSLTMVWFNEFIKWLGRVKLVPYCVNQTNKPSEMKGQVMIISYEMLMRYIEDVEKHRFDLLICDEGHRLKNSSIRTTQLLQSLNCDKRILLTGTPIQNDLQEFYALVDFVNPNVLGSPSEFNKTFVEPILASRQPNADDEDVARGKECFQDLQKITSKFLLRRTQGILKNYLPPKHEIVVFCKITDTQKQSYNSLIDSYVGSKEELFGIPEIFSPLELITALRKVCSHPSLLKKDSLRLNSPILQGMIDYTSLINNSSKITVTINFLTELKKTSPKEKVVLVSSSTQTLDLLGKILDFKRYSWCRLDGSTPSNQRNEIVERFNQSYCDLYVFLLSAKAGGVGLNLTGASRLILFDSDWNPATDLQAIARIWRDGQKFPVYIYRLLTAGTIEEKIYQRQISKQGLCEGTIDPENAKSIKLSNEELKDIFSPCFLEEDCLTHNILSCNCNKQGEIPDLEIESETVKETDSCIKISELFHWEHHGHPFNPEFLSQLCLTTKGMEKAFKKGLSQKCIVNFSLKIK